MALLDTVQEFHKHLDECELCRNHPFRMCDTGARLLEIAARIMLRDSTQTTWTAPRRRPRF